MWKTVLIFSIFLLIVCAKAETDIEPLPGHTVTIKAGDLKLIAVDNAGFGLHPERHNGIAYLSHKADTTNFFRDRACGINFEFIFDGEKWWEPYEVYFEPRTSPMEIRKISERKVELYQSPTKYHNLESWLSYEIAGKHDIDIEFTCIPRADTFDRGYIGLFFASYPALSNSDGFYYIGVQSGKEGRKWLEQKTPAHNVNSTVRYENDEIELTFNEKFKPTLYNNYSENRYSYPFYYGRRNDMVYIIMFDQAGSIRFAHSPNSGSSRPDVTEPAWDYQYIIPEYRVGEKYGYKARIVYKPFISAEDVVSEYENWSGKTVEF